MIKANLAYFMRLTYFWNTKIENSSVFDPIVACLYKKVMKCSSYTLY